LGRLRALETVSPVAADSCQWHHDDVLENMPPTYTNNIPGGLDPVVANRVGAATCAVADLNTIRRMTLRTAVG
jgi:hypothetical protein